MINIRLNYSYLIAIVKAIQLYEKKLAGWFKNVID